MLMPDEQLDHLAGLFLEHGLATLLGITFEQYLQDVHGHNQTALYLMDGGGLCAYYQPPRPVGKAPRKQTFNRLQQAI